MPETSARVTSAVVRALAEVKPNLGTRSCKGCCPPSKPGRTPPPALELCPLWPRPAVLP